MEVVTYPEDPRRCRAADKHGQCWNVALTGTFCPTHRVPGQLTPEADRRRVYNLTKARFKERLEDKMSMGPPGNLDELIRITELLHEDTLNDPAIKDQVVINREHHAFVQSITRLNKAARELKEQSDELLGRPAIVFYSQQVIQLIIDELQGVDGWEAKIDRITGRMLETIELTTNSPKEDSHGVPDQAG